MGLLLSLAENGECSMIKCLIILLAVPVESIIAATVKFQFVQKFTAPVDLSNSILAITLL